MAARKKPELLMPAGNLSILKIAILFGADAVYIGGDMYGLRANADNFSYSEMKEGIEFAHGLGKKVYVTANIIAHNDDIPGIESYFAKLRDIGPDALIISDPGVFTAARRVCPDIPVHISTQSNNVNYETFKFWHRLGASRVVCGRELSIEEIAEIRKKVPDELEIEAFVHGSMCVSYSGRCLLSNYFTGRDANKGECTHPCRWKYYLMEETRPGEYMPVFENERGTYIFNSKDLCMIEHIPDLCEAGIDSFKVEGRMKTAMYAAGVGMIYRMAIDDYFTDEELYREKIPFYLEELSKGTYRRYSTGFFYGKPDHGSQIYDSGSYVKTYAYLGMITGTDGEGLYVFEQKNKFSVGDEIEVMRRTGRVYNVKVLKMKDDAGRDIKSCPHPGERISIDVGIHLEKYDIMRKKEN